MDELLVKRRLWGDGLVLVTNPVLIARYNECLVAAGITPTQLKSFHIDGKGWSPEVAEEKGDPFYLSNGGAVQYGIIISTDQMVKDASGAMISKPVLRPYYSFERYVLDTVYTTHWRAIADLTSRTGIWIEIDPGFVRFEDPRDLNLVKSVAVQLADTAGIMAAAVEQRAMVNRFLTEHDAWEDDGLRMRIVESAKKYRDLRFRDVVIPPLKVTNLEYVNAECFGGTFSLRNPGMKDSLLVVVGEVPKAACPTEQSFGREGDASRVYTFAGDMLMSKLIDDGFVEISADFYLTEEGKAELESLKDCILVDVLHASEGGGSMDINALTSLQKKRRAIEAKNMPPEYFELEKYCKAIDIGEKPAKISKHLQMMLMRPKRDLPDWAVRVIWRLISRMAIYAKLPTITLRYMYLYDKPRFFKEFASWPESRQIWAIENLEKQGLTPASSKGA